MSATLLLFNEVAELIKIYFSKLSNVPNENEEIYVLKQLKKSPNIFIRVASLQVTHPLCYVRRHTCSMVHNLLDILTFPF